MRETDKHLPAAPNRQPLTLLDWLDAYRTGAAPRALLTDCLRRARADSPPGVWITLASDADIERQLVALESSARAEAGIEALLERYPLFGVPYAVKDNIDVAGVPTTAACPAYAYMAGSSAEVVSRLEAAGAVCMGKTNLDQFATGLVGTRSPYGQPASVFSSAHVSGGSSSGSAVAVALGLVAFSLGTDTAGSGRVPAAFNQIVGLKPTPGRVSTRGVVPACRSLDCVSVFALTVRDAAQVLAVIEGPDERDAYSRFLPGPADWAGDPRRSSLRVGVPRALRFSRDSGYEGPWSASLDHLAHLGHRVVPLDFDPLHETAELLYAGPWVAERHLVVERMLRERPDELDPVVREVVASGGRFSAADAFRAQYELRRLQGELQKQWQDVDVLMVPGAPGHPRFDEVAAEPIAANSLLGTYTNFVNLLGWCALALPAGTAAGGLLPFGVTFIASSGRDAALARLGSRWQASLALPMGATGALPRDGAAPDRLRGPAVEPTLPLAVVGAHLSGMPLNGQLLQRGACLAGETTTAPRYRLYALPDSTPRKPGLVRVTGEGQAIALEVWNMPTQAVGSFLELIPAPLGLGRVELADGRWVAGFLCESHAVAQAEDVSRHGGWRAYLNSLDARAPSDAATAARITR